MDIWYYLIQQKNRQTKLLQTFYLLVSVYSLIQTTLNMQWIFFQILIFRSKSFIFSKRLIIANTGNRRTSGTMKFCRKRAKPNFHKLFTSLFLFTLVFCEAAVFPVFKEKEYQLFTNLDFTSLWLGNTFSNYSFKYYIKHLRETD